MYLVRFDLFELMGHWLEKPIEEIFTLLLKKISASELKSFLEEAAQGDHSLQQSFIIRFLDSANIPSSEKYSLLIRSIIRLAKEDSEKFQQELSRYLSKGKQFIEARDYLDAFYLLTSLISEYKQLSIHRKDFASEPLIKTFSLLSSISKSDAGFELKEMVFDFLLNKVKSSAEVFSAFEREIWIQTLIDTVSEENQFIRILDLIVEFIGENRSQYGESKDEMEKEQLLTMKLQLLELLNRHEDIHRLLESNKDIKTFRLKLIEEFIQQQQWEEAKELIKEGRRNELKKGSINLTSEWDEMLLKIAQQENDMKSIRNLALQLFLESDYDFKYYQLLKQHYDPSRWKLNIDRIVTSIRKEKSFSTKGIHAVAKIFIEDEEWDKLLSLLDKNASLDFIEQYADHLKEKFPEQLLEIYRKAIRRYAEKYMGPESYRVVVNALKKMQSLPKSKEIVQSLAIELKVTYRQRRAMVEELNKVML